MKIKFALVLGILLGATGTLFAQWPPDSPAPPANKFFDLPYFSIADAWHFDLGKGNFMELELADHSQMSRYLNVDSLLLVFLDDVKPLRDSLADPVSGKRIDYLIDTAGRKFVRIRETRPNGGAYLLGDDQPSLLRTRQDTIHILLLAPPASRKSYLPLRYNRLTLVINRYDQLQSLVASGLNNKMKEADPATRHRYKDDANGSGYLAIDPTVTIKKEGMYGNWHSLDFSETYGLVGVQNYRNLFASSGAIGDNFVLHHRFDIHTIGIRYSGFVLFANDSNGHAHDYVNDIISISYSYDHLDPTTLRPAGLWTNFSFGWFVHREGSFVPRKTYVVTFGSLQLMNGRFLVEPGGYITGNHTTPFIRVSFRWL
ncbi:MAG TPA: hypothetical protein VHE54_10645 [Puia sp.]|nr:hypothetical protein [Puia sp.]